MSAETILLLGVNHKTTPLAIREKLALGGGYEAHLAALGQRSELDEFFVLSTCNRVELLCCTREPAAAAARLEEYLFGAAVGSGERSRYLYHYQDQAAVEHLFLVAASLDSMVVGEAQILGQLKEAFRQASEQHATGLVLNRLLHKAFSVAKRVRTETRIGASAVSISYAAVELARKIFGELKGRKAMLIGAGEMAELAAEHLLSQGIAQVMVANRTLERAVALARRFQGQAVALEEVTQQLAEVDIIVSSTGAPGIILSRDEVRPVMRQRRNRPLFFIDIAVPRDLDPAINEIDNVYLYDIDDLQHVIELNKAEREQEAVKARRIVEEEALQFGKWRQGLALNPTIAALRRRAETACRLELDKTLARLPQIDADQRQALERMLQSVSSRLLHHPLQYLKNDHPCLPPQDRIQQVHTIFRLDQEDDGEA
ncbi:MAG: glutamyl-tRNA reductase [Desulfobulbaceae bacterium A2]|nr:MAG: glutamyl-tRNA reductase [Desulfobulbaceae bacterium A2]